MDGHVNVMRGRLRYVLVLIVPVALAACNTPPTAQYDRPLPAGSRALHKVPPDQWPDMATTFARHDAELDAALTRSIEWFEIPSTQRFYPIEAITHEQARLSAFALRRIMAESVTPQGYEAKLREAFDLYMSVGWNGRGTVLFTGYFSPIFEASRTQTQQFRFPLYGKPEDLEADPATGQVRGWKVGQVYIRYPKRSKIESDPQRYGLEGRELVYLASPLQAYFIHVNGSARLRMTDGSAMYVGYAGSNGRAYTSIGRLLVRDGKITEEQISLQAIRDYFQTHPEELETYTHRNDRFVFFQAYDGDAWPSGSLGFKVTPWRTLATDKTIFPRGCPVMVVTEVPSTDAWPSTARRRFQQIMADQDTGGAIRAPGRADIYMGIGSEAEAVAGRQAAEGRLYYLVLRDDQVDAWRDTYVRGDSEARQASTNGP